MIYANKKYKKIKINYFHLLFGILNICCIFEYQNEKIMKTLKTLTAGTKFQFQNDKNTYIVTRNQMAETTGVYEGIMFYKKMGTSKIIEIRDENVGRSSREMWNRCKQQVNVC